MATFEGGPSLRQRRAVPLPSLLAEQCFESLDRRRRDLCYLQRRLPGSITRAPGRGVARSSLDRPSRPALRAARQRTGVAPARESVRDMVSARDRSSRASRHQATRVVRRSVPAFAHGEPDPAPGLQDGSEGRALRSRYAGVDSRSDGSPKWLPTIGLAEAYEPRHGESGEDDSDDTLVPSRAIAASARCSPARSGV